MSETPREMTRADIKQAVSEYRNAAQVARDAGFDGVQIQAGFVTSSSNSSTKPQIAGPTSTGAVSKTVPVSCLKYWRPSWMSGRASG